MSRTSCQLAFRLALALAVALCAGALAGCNKAPALSKVELDAAKMPEKHPKVAPDVASNCRACHHEQPAIRK